MILGGRRHDICGFPNFYPANNDVDVFNRISDFK